MPDVEDVSYSREATIQAFRDYYRFLVELYMDGSYIIEPPEGGWPSISPEFQKASGKSDEVIALLRNLPYIRSDCPNDEFHPPQAAPGCYWADWQSLAVDTVTDAAATKQPYMMSAEEGLKVTTEGAEWENVPSHVIGLTSGHRENKIFLLDTKLGIIHWPECDGGGDYRHNYDDDPSFIDPVYDVDEHVPENEQEWRSEPAWAIADLLELFKMQYRKLKWIPVNTQQVVATDFSFDKSQDGMIPMLQGIFREHGWSLEQEEATHYRKRECMEAVDAALKERYPSFEGWV